MRGRAGAGWNAQSHWILGTTSRTASYARALADRFKQAPNQYPHIDGVVAIRSSEGGGNAPPNNIDFVLRTLAGFMVHPKRGRGARGRPQALNSLQLAPAQFHGESRLMALIICCTASYVARRFHARSG